MQDNSIIKSFMRYDDERYQDSLLITISLMKQQVTDKNILMIIKNIVALSGFTLKNHKTMSMLVFWYFFKKWSVDFSNGYSLKCKNEKLTVDMEFFGRKTYSTLSNFSQFFDLGKNEIFLSKIVDTTNKPYTEDDKNARKLKANNIFDFFILFLHENFELYSLEGEEFPLFKWLINELAEDI